MASEAVIIDLGHNKGNPYMWTVPGAGYIRKGALCIMYDPRSSISSGTTISAAAGIAAADKDGADTENTTLAEYSEGIFDLVSTGTLSAGSLVVISGINVVGKAEGLGATLSGANFAATEILRGKIFGKALEDGSANEVIAVKLMLI